MASKSRTVRGTCTHDDGCSGLIECRDLCAKHYHRMRKEVGPNLPPILQPCKRCQTPFDRARKPAALCMECRKEWRWCSGCEAAWEIGDYKIPQGVYTWPCQMHLRDHQLRVRMGITLEQYSDLLRRQGGVCAIDGCDEREDLHVDHDHTCCPVRKACLKCIRGLICARHNHALGKVRDSIAELEALAKYLVRYAVKPAEGGDAGGL